MKGSCLRLCGALMIVCLGLVGCSSISLKSDKVDYASAQRTKPLDVPPDLSQLPSNDRFSVPATASATMNTAQTARVPTQTVAPATVNARLERAGSQNWLAVDVPPERAFAEVKAFLPTVGLAIDREDPKLGIIETTWAENRAKLPQDIIRRTLGRVLDQAYSTGEQDKYRVRVERTAQGNSEIFISHRGMVEVYTSNAQDRTMWQPRPSDPEMEVELLRRLALRFEPKPAATTATAGPATVQVAAAPETARLLPAGGDKLARVQIDEPFDRAWRRVGLALDRGGFTVEDRDRAGGVYFVRYLDPEYEAKQRGKQGFLSKIFGSEPKIDAQQFRIVVASRGSHAEVTVLDAAGKPDSSSTADKILKQINEQLK